MDDNGHVNRSSFGRFVVLSVNLCIMVTSQLLFTRVLTRSERIFTRLRIWLVCHAYKSFGSVGVCRFGSRSVLKFTAVTRVAEAANIEYIPLYPFIGFKTSLLSKIKLTSSWTILTHLRCEDLIPGTTARLLFAAGRIYNPDACFESPKSCGSGFFDIRLAGDPFPPFASVKKFHARLGHEFVLKSQNNLHMWSHFEVASKRRYHTKFTQISCRETSLSKTARLQLSLIGSRQVGILSTGSTLDGQLAITIPREYGVIYWMMFWTLTLTSWYSVYSSLTWLSTRKGSVLIYEVVSHPTKYPITSH